MSGALMSKEPGQAYGVLVHGACSSAPAELICTHIVTVLCDETVRCKKNGGGEKSRCRLCDTSTFESTVSNSRRQSSSSSKPTCPDSLSHLVHNHRPHVRKWTNARRCGSEPRHDSFGRRRKREHRGNPNPAGAGDHCRNSGSSGVGSGFHVNEARVLMRLAVDIPSTWRLESGRTRQGVHGW